RRPEMCRQSRVFHSEFGVGMFRGIAHQSRVTTLVARAKIVVSYVSCSNSANELTSDVVRRTLICKRSLNDAHFVDHRHGRSRYDGCLGGLPGHAIAVQGA